MTTKRTGQPWQTPAAYGRTLMGLSVNLIVRDVARSLPFYTDVLGFTALYGDADYAALERDGMRLQLHADHAYDGMPWAPELAAGGRRGLGAEIRLLGLYPTCSTHTSTPSYTRLSRDSSTVPAREARGRWATAWPAAPSR